jgi:hypothetical protein
MGKKNNILHYIKLNYFKIIYKFRKKILIMPALEISLEELIFNTGPIAENILQQISYRLLKTLDSYYQKTGKFCDFLHMENIFFDSKCNFKVSVLNKS